MQTLQETRMLTYIEGCNDPQKLRSIIKNAAAKNARELWRAAKLRLFQVLPKEEVGTLEYDVWQAIFALEDALSDERGKTIRLSRTRQKIAKKGEADCVADLVLGPPSEGFKMLTERNMLRLSFEATALRYPDRFDEKVREAADARLREAGHTSE